MSEPASKPSSSSSGQAAVPTPGHMSPGDQAPAGTPGTGENTCRRCGGSGSEDGKPCPDCEGTGMVITGIGGA